MAENGTQPHPWQIVDEKLFAACRIYDVYERHCVHPADGRKGNFYVIHSKDWALTLPLTPNNEIILVQQYRFGTDQLSWEVPGGVMEKNESPTQAALRELKEETGYSGNSAKEIGHCRPNPALFNNTAHFVLIENCSLNHSTTWDPHEELLIRPTPLDEAFEMVKSHQIQHALVINALFFLKLHLGR